MDREKLRSILKSQRPDLTDVERETPAAPMAAGDVPADVDEYETTSSTWTSHAPKEGLASMKKSVDTKRGLSSDDIRKAFAPRELGAEKSRSADSVNPTQPETAGIRRVVKRNRLADTLGANPDASGPDAKDLIIDEKGGIIGSQG